MDKKPTYEELEARLAKAESHLQAIRDGKVDVVVCCEGVLAVRLAETHQALEKRTQELAKHRKHLEKLVEKPTAELTRAIEEDERQKMAILNVSQDLTQANKKLVLEIEERKQTEEKLRESEERFHAMFDRHHAVMLLIDPDTGAIIDANAAAQSYYGYSLETFRKMTIQDINILSSEEILELRKKAAHRKRNYFIFPHRLFGGEVRTVEVHSSPLTIKGQTILFSIIHAITERKQIETVLIQLEARLKHLVTQRPSVIYSCKPYGDFGSTFVSAKIVQLLGYSPDEFVDDPGFWQNHIHPEDSDRILAGLNRLFETEHHVHEYRFLNKQGNWQWMLDELNLIRDAEGEPIEILGSWLDITDRKRAEQALKDSETRYKRLVEGSPDIVYIFSSTRGGLYWAPRVETILGINPDDIRKNPFLWHDSIHPDDLEAVDRAIAEHGTGKDFDIQYRIKDTRGK